MAFCLRPSKVFDLVTRLEQPCLPYPDSYGISQARLDLYHSLAALRIGDVVDPHTGQVKEVVRLLAAMSKGKRFREVFLVNADARSAVLTYLCTRSLPHIDAPSSGFSAAATFPPTICSAWSPSAAGARTRAALPTRPGVHSQPC